MADFVIKRNDLLPLINATIQDSEDNAIDITGCTVRFHMTTPGGTLVVDKPAFIPGTYTSGVVEYWWKPGETAVEGHYLAEFVVTWPNGKTTTFPNKTHFVVHIKGDLY